MGFLNTVLAVLGVKKKNQPIYSPADQFEIFIPDNHLQPPFKKVKFESLHSWDLGWELLSPINIAQPGDAEVALSKRLSPGQKALYFFWYLDADVTNGGFIQFFLNGKSEYIPAIKKGLELIADKAMLNLLSKAEAEYLANKADFDKVRSREQFSALYKKLKNFEPFDNKYYEIHDNTMASIEAYARQHPEEFVKLI